MKATVLIAIFILIAFFAFGQNETLISPGNISEIKVTPPVFTGVLYSTDSEDDALSPISNFLCANVQYPAEAFYSNIQGTEVVQITIDIKGNITEYKIINSVYPEIDKEMISALKKTSGMWKPGYNNDNPVEMTKEISMHFCVKNLKNTSVKEIFTEEAKASFDKGSYTLFEKENFKKALKHYNKGINYLPYDKSLLLLRGLCRYELGDKEGALQDWNRMTNLGETIDMSDYTALLQGMKGYDELMAVMKN